MRENIDNIKMCIYFSLKKFSKIMINIFKSKMWSQNFQK